MKTLVTGATGFVGAAVARALAAAGFSLRLLVRAKADGTNLTGLAAETVTGDLRDEVSLERAVRGCEAVFHVAADYRIWAPDADAMYRTNVNGTASLMRAALKAGVRRVVYTSSVACVGLPVNGGESDETADLREKDLIGHYKRSKYLAEKTVLDMVREEGLPAVVVNPSTPMGPGDVKPTPTGRIVRDYLRGRMPAYVDTGLNVVHVDDVAAGHLLALTRGMIGERYILGGENMSLKDLLGHLAAITNGRAPAVRLPHRLLYPVALACEAWSRLTGVEPVVCRDALRMSTKQMFFSSDKARRELGYDPRPAVEALADAVRWFSDRP